MSDPNELRLSLARSEGLFNEASELDSFHESTDSNEEPWLISYADLMTLLFGFFAMLFSYVSLDDDASVKVNKELVKYFGGVYVSPAQKLTEEVKDQWSKGPYKKEMDVKVQEDGLEISFITSLLFEPGKANLLPESLAPLKVLIQLIKDAEKGTEVRVEGHTDDNPISSSVFPSNWELSSARAAAIVRMFQSEGFPEERLSLAGYGASRPAYPNRDSSGEKIVENQSLNRRVVVKVILPKGQKKSVPLPVREMPGGKNGE
ncbi:MAG: OmpA/MotB family protein [Bdellovibrionia bacterium]